MPTPSPPSPGAPLSRRTLLAALAGLGGATLVGCTSKDETHPAKAHPAPAAAEADPDVTVAAEALAGQRQMLDLLAATTRRHRALETQLAPVVQAHKAHAALLARAVPKGYSVPPSPSAAPSSPASPSSSGSPSSASSSPLAGASSTALLVPGSRARALAQVVEAEQELVTVTKRQAFRAESGAFARILASMAAAAAQSAAVLSASTAGGAS